MTQKKRNAMTKEEMKKRREKEMQKGNEKKEPQITVPEGVYPTNGRIYTVDIETGISYKGDIALIHGKADISSKTFFVAVADPNITYKHREVRHGFDKDKIVEKQLKAGDIVRPFVLMDAEHYRPITDTINGVVYTIFERTEIASIIPVAESGVILEEGE